MHLAALDGARTPHGASLVAERDGRMVAAVPFGGGRAIADPFEPTADVLALLELRARQVREADAVGGRRAGLLRRLTARLA
jgi:hypothetical protein